jgi:arylsulfatase A-like enzyme
MMSEILKNRFYALSLCLLLAGSLLLVACDRDSSSRQLDSLDYNVVLISIDTLRADHLGVYGYSKDTSPNIDAFSKDSILFTTSIAQAPSTLPSHASIFTGMLPVNHGAFAASQTPISSDLDTLPEIMRDAGFRTISYNGGGLVNAVYGFDRGFEDYVSERKGDLMRNKVSQAIDWLDSNSDDKFFMFLHTYEVHDPYSPEQKYLELFESTGSSSLPNNMGARELAAINRHDANPTEQDIDHVRNLYNAEIRSMDDAFGDLITYLREKNLYDNTLIVFTSDHGEEFGEHGKIGRHFFTLYDELIHVPLIIKMPNSQLAGQLVEKQVRGIDLLPTILGLVDIDFTPDIDGQSLVPLMFREDVAPLIAVSQQDTSDALPPTSIRTQNRKLILWPTVLDDPELPYLWVEDKFEFNSDATTITVAMASADASLDVRVLMNGVQAQIKHLTAEPSYYPIILKLSGQPGSVEDNEADQFKNSNDENTLVTIESTIPCVTAGADSASCRSFRVFNPQEYYLLDSDVAELRNEYMEEDYQAEISVLRTWLDAELAGLAGAKSEKVELDEKTKQQLKSLGYLN